MVSESKDDIIKRLVAKQFQNNVRATEALAEAQRQERDAAQLKAKAAKDWDGAKTRIMSEVAATNTSLKPINGELKFDKTNRAAEGVLLTQKLWVGAFCDVLSPKYAAVFEVRLNGKTTVWIGDGGEHALQKFVYDTEAIMADQANEVITSLLKFAER